MQKLLVGGAVRDKILGRPCKDLDYIAILSGNEDGWRKSTDPFKVMVDELENTGHTIFLQSPEFLTVRARDPNGEVADFVLPRADGIYQDGRHPDSVRVGSIVDDLARRDFTMNALAMNDDGDIIDMHGGQDDIAKRVIRAVGDPSERLAEDALRAVRAMRFSVTLGFEIDPHLAFAMRMRSVAHSVQHSVSDERIREEVNKMSRNTFAMLDAFDAFPGLTHAMFSGRLRLEATMKE